MASYHVGDFEEAEWELRKALELAPEAVWPLPVLARIQLWRGDWEGSVETGREALRRAPDDAAIRIQIATNLVIGEEPEHRDPEEALRLTDSLPSGYKREFIRAIALLRLGKPAQALALIDRLPSLGPSVEDPAVAYAIAAAHAALGHPEEARKAYARADSGGAGSTRHREQLAWRRMAEEALGVLR